MVSSMARWSVDTGTRKEQIACLRSQLDRRPPLSSALAEKKPQYRNTVETPEARCGDVNERPLPQPRRQFSLPLAASALRRKYPPPRSNDQGTHRRHQEHSADMPRKNWI